MMMMMMMMMIKNETGKKLITMKLYNKYYTIVHEVFDRIPSFHVAHNDNTISAAERTIENLISTLETESQAATEWFKLNEMIVNPEEFQAIVVKKNEGFIFLIND